MTPAGLDYVFSTGSGSESADTSLKMARAYWPAKGQGTKTHLIRREKGYHGVNFGGISVGGIGPNRKLFGQGIAADFLPHTQLAGNSVTPLAAHSLMERFGPVGEPADLASVNLLRTPLEHWTPWFRVANLDWPEPTRGPKLVDLGLLLEAAVSGQGVALGSPALARHWLSNGTLLPLFPLKVSLATPYLLMPHASQGAAGTFARWLVGVCERAVQEASEFLSGQA